MVDKIASGGERDIYLHPEDPTVLIKIHKDIHVKRNYLDCRCIGQANGSARNILPHFVGWVKTNRGHGAVYQAIRDSDGSISRQLLELANSGEISEADGRALLIDFFSVAFENNLPMHDIHFRNLLVQIDGDRRRLILVDGFGPRREGLKAYLRQKIRMLYLYKAIRIRRKTMQNWNDLWI